MKKINIIFILLIFSCTSESKKDNKNLSLIVLTDTVIVYDNEINQHSHIDSIAFDEKTVKDLIDKKRRSASDSFEVLIKLTGYGSSLGNSAKISNWCKEIGLEKFRIIDIDSVAGKFFKLHYVNEP